MKQNTASRQGNRETTTSQQQGQDKSRHDNNITAQHKRKTKQAQDKTTTIQP